VRKLRLSATLLASLFIVSSLHAVTYIVPTDRDLVRRADAIVVATAIDSHAQLNEHGAPVTVATLAIDEVLKGNVSESSIELFEPGGVLAEKATMIPGAPRYAPGEQYLVFLRRNSDGDWATFGFGLGKFQFMHDLSGRDLVSRGSAEDEVFGYDEGTEALHVEYLRDASAFLRYVRTVNANADVPARADYFVDRGQVVLLSFPQFQPKPASFGVLATRPDYLSTGNFRWPNPTATWVYCCVSKGLQPSFDGPGAVSAGVSNWSSAVSAIHYTAGGNDESATGGLAGVGRGSSDGRNGVLFNDPFNDFAAAGVPAGVAGLGGISNACCPYNSLGDGFSYFTTTEGDVVIAKNVTTNQATFNGILTHELGHTLGFRHSNQFPDNSTPCNSSIPCTTSAVMNSVVAFGLQTLQTYDVDAANTVYGSGPVCTSPTISANPQSQTISAGQQVTLSVGATGGSTPYSYKWFTGNPGSGTQISGQTAATLSVSPTTTTTYYATVTSACGGTAATSAAATLTVSTCTIPAITLQPVSQTISSGSTASLSMGFSGTPGTVTWYQGTPTNRSNPVGSGQNFTTPGLTTNTTYWAEIVNSCGSAQTNAATISVTPGNTCTIPAITLQPTSQSISSGSTATLSMGYTGSSGTVTWYQGTPTNRASAVGSGQNFTTPPLTANTNYWAEIVNGCGSAQTVGVTITVITGPGCTIPTITLQPASQSISTGGTASLSMGYSGTAGTVTWYQGTPPNRTAPVGSTQNFTTPALSTNTSYWAEVVNSCGSAQTIAAVITVSPGNTCTNAAIVSHPVSGSIIVGGITTLSVSASGSSPLAYQWYQGAKGDTSKPVGTNSASFTSSPISANTSFWVRVTNTCNGTQTADSNAASITVTVARHRGVRH
jgi:hypothetical protein